MAVSIVNRIWRRVQRFGRRVSRIPQARKLGIVEAAENCLYLNRFSTISNVVDVGCADDANLSLHVIEQHGVRSFGVDPTRKHKPALDRHVAQQGGRFVHVPVAVSDVSGVLTFHESVHNASGSLESDHHNVRDADTRSYEVTAVTLDGLLETIKLGSADYLKLDLEGVEYRVLEAASRETLDKFGQIFVEFHHHCMPQYSQASTRAIARKMESYGFSSFSYDDHNYLFYRPATGR
jgi:FkbM family methyltransferase